MNDKEDTPSQLKIVGVQATGGMIAGAVTSCVSTPLDTIKTRLQVTFMFLIIVAYFCLIGFERSSFFKTALVTVLVKFHADAIKMSIT